jgi:hypothetical protein
MKIGTSIMKYLKSTFYGTFSLENLAAVLRLLIFSKHLLDKGGCTSVTVSAYHFIDSNLKCDLQELHLET